MTFKLFISIDPTMVDSEEHHLDAFPTMRDFFTFDGPLLRRVLFEKLAEVLPLCRHSLTSNTGGELRPGQYVKWRLTGDELLDPEEPVYFSVLVQ